MPEEMFTRLSLIYHQSQKVLAPQIKPYRVELPPTITPPEEEDSQARSLRIGYVGPVPEAIFERAPWHRLSDGSRIKRIELHSRNATALRVMMTDPGPVQLRVYDPVTMSAFGPYTSPTLNEDGTWWSTIIFGDTIGLEFYLPAEYTAPPSVLPRIVGALYCYKDLTGSDFYPQSGDCHTDLMCYPSWANSIEGRAIGLILFSSSGDSFLCTGALIVRDIGDFSPILMTARHCLGTQAEANTAVIIWFYQSQTCNGKNPPNPNTLPRNDGTLLLKTDASSDWTLLGLYTPPGSDSYIGWDSSYLPIGSSVVTIGHPRGYPKRIQFGTKTSDTTCFGTAGTFRMISTTGLGSRGDSGSPLYDINRRARGTLSCGPSDCTNESNFGRLDVAFPEVRWYLFNPANPTFVNRAVAGDPGNDGSTERGTSSNPFNTVYEGAFCVPSNGTVRIVPGNYNERFTLWRPMRLEREGASGVVRIGAP
ncbi:MAG: serine protease [Fimbriimonadales bacterium]